MIATKVCSKCGVEKELTKENWHLNKSKKNGFHNWCKNCAKEYERKYRDKHREYKRKYYEENRDKRREYELKYREELRNYYVRGKLIKSGITDITPELIELKRQQIEAKRLLKEIKKWREENGSNNTDVQGQQREDEKTYERQSA